MNIEEAIDILTQKEVIDLSNHFNNTRFFEAINTLLNAYEKEKEKNSKAIGHIEACKTSLGNYILSPKETEYLLEILEEE